MNDKIKTHLTTAYMMFVFDFADPSQVSSQADVKDLFESQKSADKAKRTHGRDGFRKLLSLHFNQFQTKGALDHDSLKSALIRNKKVYLRHLGKDKVTFLLLIVTLLKDLDYHPPKRGLLFERISA